MSFRLKATLKDGRVFEEMKDRSFCINGIAVSEDDGYKCKHLIKSGEYRSLIVRGDQS